MTKKQDIIAQNNLSTVVAEYEPLPRKAKNYQSEAELEKEFIELLQSQGYEYLKINSEKELVDNLRAQIEKLNNYQFTDEEWDKFFKEEIANPNLNIEDKTKIIQEDHIKTIKKKDGSLKNIYLIDKKDIHKNSLQVINQYTNEEGERKNRYDVTILVNGLPLVHIELKRRGVPIREAFNQIERYQRESFWASSGLFEFVQIFVISNGTHTKYYSNTTRFSHIKELETGGRRKGKKSSHSFEFTSWWADETNKPIQDLIDFTRTFFARHTLLNILTKYCVFTVDKQLLVMRPYQIVATEKILNKIEVAHNYKQYGSKEAGGYIWHTTGSGKTLTSFKTAQLASKLPYIEKVLFVVDRKDLDYQTMREYDKFEKGAANSNTSTAVLKKQLEDPKARIIITTIQKLDRFIKQNKGHAILDGEVVLIFDECHRSQFGDMHRAITKAFKKYYLFGFTGTPIFAVNSARGKYVDLQTTEQAFGQKLHSYTIVDAIADKNVLPFKVDYVSTLKKSQKAENDDSEVQDINREKALKDPRRIENIVKYILDHFDQKTKRNKSYTLKDKRLTGFNAMFAVSSIEMAKLYYLEFKKQMADLPENKRLKVATIFSYAANEEIDGTIDENPENTELLDKTSRDFLEEAIADYNKMFGTNYDTSSYKFQNYYKDVSARVKNRDLDLLIVVNMFLTGFDATTLNTLWVDKNLRYHGLIQAYSRTNRILNSIKTHGNIVCFRNLEKATNDAIALFGNKEAKSVVLIKTFDEYYNGYKDGKKHVPGYKEIVEELLERFPIGKRIESEEEKKEFIRLFGKFLKVRNILASFDEFEGKEILSERDLQDYQSIYIDLYDEFRRREEVEKEDINDDLVFEMELVKQVEINIDYILKLVKDFWASGNKNKEVLLENIDRAIRSSMELRKKKDLIEQFIKSLDPSADVENAWEEFVEKKKIEELDRIIEEEGLDREKTYAFIENVFLDGEVPTTGTEIVEILPPVSMFEKDEKGESVRMKKKQSVLEKLRAFFERFFDIASGRFG